MQEYTYGYKDEDSVYHVTDKTLFNINNPDIEKFKEKWNLKDVVYEQQSPLYSYHMGNGGHGRM